MERNAETSYLAADPVDADSMNEQLEALMFNTLHPTTAGTQLRNMNAWYARLRPGTEPPQSQAVVLTRGHTGIPVYP